MARIVELYIGGAWVDVTAGRYVLADPDIVVSRGRTDASADTTAGRCTLTLIDRDKNGRWSNRVPGSAYYRQLGRNTPVRVSVDGDVRFVGEIASTSPGWDVTGSRVTVAVEAAGVLRRLTTGARALRRPAVRAILAADPVAYWPLDDGTDATRAASALPGGAPMTLSGTIDFASVTGPLGQTLQPELLDSTGAYTGQLVGPVSYTDDSYWQIDVSVRGESNTTNDQMNALGFDVADSAKFVRGEVNLVHDNGAGTSQINVYFYDNVGNVATFLADSGLQTIDGDWHHLSVKMVQGASTFDMELWADGSIVNSASAISGDIGRVSKVYTPGRVVDGAVNNFTSLSVSDLAVYNNNSDPADRYQGRIGHAGETAGRRIERLCGEEGVAFEAVGDLDDSAVCGPQTPDTLLTNLQVAATVDQGALYETRDAVGLSYRPLSALYNQTGPVIDYSAGLLADLEPDEDIDMTAHNDVTASRPDGSSARVTLDVAVDVHHVLTTQSPPDGIGVYDRGPIDANVYTDDQLKLLAYWRRHIGTWDELRYRRLSAELAAPAWVANPTLAAAVAALDTGDQLRLDGLPAWLPPGDVWLQVQGSAERIGTHTRTLTWNLVPGQPWEVWQLDTSGSTLAAPVTSNGTSLKLATSTGPAWSETAEPYHLQAFGNAVTVTAMATDTPAFIAAGTAAHADNASVSPSLPAGMTVDTGQVLLCWAAIRNSGTGTVDLPSGWTNIAQFGNTRLFGRYYLTGVTAPTVTFTGGAANATCSAQLYGFSGTSLHAEFTATQLNGSAQDIAAPAGPTGTIYNRRNNRLLLWCGWKQDDWTSAAVLTGGFASEAGEASSTLGDDQAIVVDYFTQTTAAQPGTGTIAITGGASAISRAVVVGLRPLQTATVTRGINDVSTSIAAGEAVHAWRLGVLAL